MGNSCITNKISNSHSEDVTNIPKSDIILKWESNVKTSRYHWWPMWETKINDRSNNLYSKRTGLDKYDILFETKSIKYQHDNYRIPFFSHREDKKWAGFCNYASILSSLYEYPKKDVTVRYNNKCMKFDVWDIEALMICATDNAIKKNISIFFGLRNNDNSLTSIEEPKPSDLLTMLEVLCKYDKPFIMDIDNRNPVWNYAYDKVLILKLNTCSYKHIKPILGETIYYNFRIGSTAYPEKTQHLWSYINTIYDKQGNVVKKTEKWISTIHPDFLWCKFPLNEPWQGKCVVNPEIDANIVYKIYMESLKDVPQLLVIC
jgi:hypothetical protein